MRISVIDLGTFSGLLLVAEVHRRQLRALHEERLTVDLAYDSAGNIKGPAVRRAKRVLQHFIRTSRELGAVDGLIVATAALRHARNRNLVLQALRESADIPIRVLSARAEADFTALGAVSGLASASSSPLIVDVGGGSTELINTASNTFKGLPVGAAWATSDWADLRPRRRDQRDLYYLGCAERATARLATWPPPDHPSVVGVGGTITALAAIHARLDRFDLHRIHGTRLSTDWIAAAAAQWSVLGERDIKKVVPFDPSRSRILLAGTYLWSAVLNRLNADHVTVSARGLRWGVAAHLTGSSHRLL